MPSDKVEITGIKALAKKLGLAEEQINSAARRTVKETAEGVKKRAKDLVPVESGRLQRSINASYSSNGLQAEVKNTNNQAYYGQFIEYGTSSRPARPFMTPAAEGQRRKIKRRLEQHVKKELGA